MITRDEIIEKTKSIPTNFIEEKMSCKTKNNYILFAFLLITKALLITGSIYCFLIKFIKKFILLPDNIYCHVKKNFVLIIYYKDGE